jgi:cell division protein FtsL
MKYLMIPLAAALLASQPVFAECTTDQINAKAKQLAERVNQLTESDPERAAEINEELRDMEVKQTAEQLGDECEAYDKRLQHVEEAEKEADIAPAEKR